MLQVQIFFMFEKNQIMISGNKRKEKYSFPDVYLSNMQFEVKGVLSSVTAKIVEEKAVEEEAILRGCCWFWFKVRRNYRTWIYYFFFLRK